MVKIAISAGVFVLMVWGSLWVLGKTVGTPGK